MIRGQKKGFTIVELLIVIVVIAILAAITIVAYNGIQARAYDSRLSSDIANIKKAVNLYIIDNPTVPICSTGNGSTCNLNVHIQPMLTNTGPLPQPQKDTFQYVGHNDTGANTQRWAVRTQKHDNTFCKFGENMTSTWFSSAPAC